MTPLHWAIEKGFDNIAELLLQQGANPYIVSKFMKTPYLIAKEKDNDFIATMIELVPMSEMKHNGLNQELNFAKRDEVSVPETSKPATQKRERIHSYDAPDVKRSKTSPTDTKNLPLQLLKEQMSMMSATVDENLITSAMQAGRKIMLTEAGKRLLNDSNLNKFLKIPLNTTISSSSSSATAKKSVSPRSATVTSRRTSDSSDVLEIFRDSLVSGSGNGARKMKPDILNIIRSSSELQEVTITQRSKTSPVPSPTQKTSISLSAINVPKVKVQQGAKQKTQLPSSPDANSVDFRPDASNRQFSELNNNYQQLKRSFEREQQKSASLQRQLKQLEVNFEVFKRQQNDKFDSLLKLLTVNRQLSGDGFDDVEEIL